MYFWYGGLILTFVFVLLVDIRNAIATKLGISFLSLVLPGVSLGIFSALPQTANVPYLLETGKQTNQRVECGFTNPYISTKDINHYRKVFVDMSFQQRCNNEVFLQSNLKFASHISGTSFAIAASVFGAIVAFMLGNIRAGINTFTFTVELYILMLMIGIAVIFILRKIFPISIRVAHWAAMLRIIEEVARSEELDAER
ncbi:hypothetical protein [Alicyclobacillus sp. SO9]|uniref:hypothetical protein n=1 Tax=Alicyclobacillus sp. SO9 TaxID=2665646 RepID=UPI0018E71C34|nr:hypothetical protein [Alicyclobacillus sp. SO9]QQE78098.1 hypothetical protein GI364_19730 [Alicyclobacillus sp. SO9]